MYLIHGIGLLVFGRRKVNRTRSFGSTPITLAHHECRADAPGVHLQPRSARSHPKVSDFWEHLIRSEWVWTHLSCIFIHDQALRLQHRSCFALVIDADHFRLEDECLSLGGRWEGFEELHHSLAVNDPAGIEFRHAGNGFRAGFGIEVDYFLGCAFECYDSGSRWSALTFWTSSRDDYMGFGRLTQDDGVSRKH